MDISNPFHAQLVQDCHDAAQRHDYSLVLSTVTPEQDEASAGETLLDSRCGALILLGPTVSARHLATLVKQVPVVVVGRPSPAPDVDVVRTDDAMGLELAVAHLHELGHQRISYVDGGDDAVSPIRSAAYRDAMRRHGSSEHTHILSGGDTEGAGAAAAAALLDSSVRPTALIAFNDRSAIGLIDNLRRNSIGVPGELSIVGYDDSPVARLGHVDLTTVSQNTRALTEHAIATIADRFEGARDDDREVIVAPRLAVRSTTAAPAPRPTSSRSH